MPKFLVDSLLYLVEILLWLVYSLFYLVDSAFFYKDQIHLQILGLIFLNWFVIKYTILRQNTGYREKKVIKLTIDYVFARLFS